MSDPCLSAPAGEAVEYRCCLPVIALRARPLMTESCVSEILFGEMFLVYRHTLLWAFGKSQKDGYVGWVENRALSLPCGAPDVRVCALHAPVLEAPELKAPNLDILFFGALGTVIDTVGQYRALMGAGWVYEGHLSNVSARESDYVAVAERFVGTPYMWGGRTASGIDCSGLVQLSWQACGILLPRDTDQQQKLGRVVTGKPERGDMVFWKGHVGIMLDDERLLHATAHTMSVVVEKLKTVSERIFQKIKSVPEIRRYQPG